MKSKSKCKDRLKLNQLLDTEITTKN